MNPTLILFVAGSLVLLGVLAMHLRLASAIARPERRPRKLSIYPSLSVIRPIRGLDVDARNNFIAALACDYPGDVETLFVLDSVDDEAAGTVIDVVREHRALRRRGRVRILIAGTPPPGLTGKLNAMMVGVKHANGQLIAFGDSDTRPAPELLRTMVDTLMRTPNAGDVFVPVVVARPAATSGDVGYELLINSWYGPAAALASRDTGDLPFIMGQIMVFKREALDAIGGVGCAAGQLVDDMYIGQCVARAGYRNVVCDARLDITNGGMSFGEFLQLFRRWVLFSRGGLPFNFNAPHWLRGAQFWGALAIADAAVAFDAWVAVLPAVLALVATAWSQIKLAHRFGGSPIQPRHYWVALAVPLLAPIAALWALAGRQVGWRGRNYTLDAFAQLSEAPEEAAGTNRFRVRA
jgi:ceramide glucosyltransferase